MSVPDCSILHTITSVTVELVGISVLMVSNIQVLQFLCQITVDCLRPCFNRFFAVIPCVIGLRKILHEIFYPVGVLQAKFNDFFFMGGVLVDSRKILIHPKAHACDKHHPQRNHGFFLCVPTLTVRTFFFFWFFDSFCLFLILLKHIFQVLSIVLLVLHRLSAVASNYYLGLHILSGRLHGTSGYFRNINTDVGYIRTSVIGRMEKHQVPSLCLREWEMLGCVILCLCRSR